MDDNHSEKKLKSKKVVNKESKKIDDKKQKKIQTDRFNLKNKVLFSETLRNIDINGKIEDSLDTISNSQNSIIQIPFKLK